jgi:hypothetical protein
MKEMEEAQWIKRQNDIVILDDRESRDLRGGKMICESIE